MTNEEFKKIPFKYDGEGKTGHVWGIRVVFHKR